MSVYNKDIFEAGFDFVPDALNQDANSDVTGDWINLENYDRAYLLMLKPAGTAGDDLSIALQQSTLATGGDAKALTFSRWWYKKGTLSSQGTWTAVVESTATSDLDLGTPTDYAMDTVAAVVLVEVRADSLDINGGFKFINAIWEGDDIGNALVINSHWILMGSRFPQAIPLSPLA
jgi:hypothetical protein